MLFDIPFGNGCGYFCGYFAMSMECIPPRNLLELVWLLGPPRLVRYIISHKQGLQVSIHSIGNAAGSFACGWWGRKELVALDHWGT